MKLNNKRTFLIGLAFFSICAFWQLYDGVVPLLLKYRYGINDGTSGYIMALDNVLAIFMLPIFGALSDKRGARMPFIIVGTVIAVVLTCLLPSASNFPQFFVMLALLLIAMGVYRSPAVALMPDVTPKPLRSKANAIINLMGALGGVYTLAMVNLIVKGSADENPNYLPLFLAVAGLMAVSVAALALVVKEKKLKAEAAAINDAIDAETAAKYDAPAGRAGRKLPPEMFRSLVLILASVALWYMGYNAVTTAYTRYATEIWGQDMSGASTCLMIATVGAVASYVPIGALATRIGRKRTILIGVGLLAACFTIAAIAADTFSPLLYVLFVIIGFAWAAINVNSYPMVVEISSSGDIGKYTGYYYTFSMAAQILTPIISGQLLHRVGYHTLFPYAAIMVALSFVTMSLTRHGDNKPEKRSKLEAFDTAD